MAASPRNAMHEDSSRYHKRMTADRQIPKSSEQIMENPESIMK